MLGGRHSREATTGLIAKQGRLYIQSKLDDRLAEREVSKTGRLGRRRMLVSSALTASSAQALPEPDGSEIWVFEDFSTDGVEQQLFVARRAPGTSRLERPKRVAGHLESGPSSHSQRRSRTRLGSARRSS